VLKRHQIDLEDSRVPKELTEPESRMLAEASESRLRLQTIVRLRWFAVLGQLIAVLVIYLGFRFPLPIGYCLLLIAVSAWLNVFLRVIFPARHRLEPAFATTLLGYDVLQLAGLLYLTGGIENPFTILMVAPVTVSAATLPPRNTIGLGIVAVALTAALVPYHLPLPWRATEPIEIPMLYKFGIFAAVVSCMTFLAVYAWRLSKEARQMSAALTATELVLAREQKLHALDGLAAAAAHELGTPLSTIVLVAKELEREMRDHPEHGEDIALLRTQAERCREILRKLTLRPTEQDPLHSSLSVRELIEEAAEPHRAQGAEILIDARPSTPHQAPPAHEPIGERRPGMIYGLSNIVENAVDFARRQVEIDARWSDKEITITVADDGPGFSPEILESIGEPYVTTRGSADLDAGAATQPTGLGLGFFIAKTLLERSGASLMLGNRSGDIQGAMVRITWPRAAFEARVSGRPTEWLSERNSGATAK
jgi:two-component system sensor histidine kinase RegB